MSHSAVQVRTIRLRCGTTITFDRVRDDGRYPYLVVRPDPARPFEGGSGRDRAEAERMAADAVRDA